MQWFFRKDRLGRNEKTNGRDNEETERREQEGFREYIEALYDQGLQIGLDYPSMYNLDLDELINTIQERRKGLAYKIWRVASFTRNPFVKDFPDTPEKAMPELFPKKQGIKMQQWMIDKYLKKERR